MPSQSPGSHVPVPWSIVWFSGKDSQITNPIMTTRSFLLLACLLVSLAVGTRAAAAPLPSLDSNELAEGPYSSMHMLLEKTFLKIDVLTVDMRFGKEIHPRLVQLARGNAYSDALGDQVAQVAIGADDALIQLRFVRDVAFDQWTDSVRENLQQVRAAGLITAKVQQQVSQGLPQWFAPLRKRGYKENDRFLYRVRPDSVRTAVVAADGKVLVDRTEKDEHAPRVVMAGYFAPGTDFREPLVRSLFEPESEDQVRANR